MQRLVMASLLTFRRNVLCSWSKLRQEISKYKAAGSVLFFVSLLAYSSKTNMGAVCFSETSVDCTTLLSRI
jgi:hypothetical protein